jgi:protein-L-isoaspartate(D-aspartate) O-methyltransferase
MNLIERIERQKREKMADSIDAVFPLDPRIKKAFINIQREKFVPLGFRHFAYKLEALPIAGRQWISSPLTVAKMTQYLEPIGVDSVLEIGCGSGYQAAILSQLARRVFTVERIGRLVVEAKRRFRELGLHNIHVKHADGMHGWKEFAPYDRILFSAAVERVPREIFDQLSPKGILVAPIIKGDRQIITRFNKNGRKEELEGCLFIDSKRGIE